MKVKEKQSSKKEAFKQEAERSALDLLIYDDEGKKRRQFTDVF